MCLRQTKEKAATCSIHLNLVMKAKARLLGIAQQRGVNFKGPRRPTTQKPLSKASQTHQKHAVVLTHALAAACVPCMERRLESAQMSWLYYCWPIAHECRKLH